MTGVRVTTLIQTRFGRVTRLGRVPASPIRSVQTRRLAFGHAVRVRRKALGLSQEKLAERAGCDRQSINRVENAAYSPSLDRVFLLADALGVRLAELLADVDEAYAQSEESRRGQTATSR
jgi:ribosome-binding protein aMBF1 (putative translation factor)